LNILPNLPPVLTVAEVARELRRSNMTIYQLIRDGSLKAIRTSTSKREKSKRESFIVLSDDLRSFIAARRQ